MYRIKRTPKSHCILIQLYIKKPLKVDMLQTHIDKLHQYNELKDCAQMVLGRIAVLEGVRTKDLYPRYNLDLED